MIIGNAISITATKTSTMSASVTVSETTSVTIPVPRSWQNIHSQIKMSPRAPKLQHNTSTECPPTWSQILVDMLLSGMIWWELPSSLRINFDIILSKITWWVIHCDYHATFQDAVSSSNMRRSMQKSVCKNTENIMLFGHYHFFCTC